MRKPLIIAGIAALFSTAALAQPFDVTDVNNDGVLDRDEFYGNAAGVGTFQDWDANDDDLIDDGEFGAAGTDWDWDVFDVNDDGYWDDEEWSDVGDEDFWAL